MKTMTVKEIRDIMMELPKWDIKIESSWFDFDQMMRLLDIFDDCVRTRVATIGLVHSYGSSDAAEHEYIEFKMED